MKTQPVFLVAAQRQNIEETNSKFFPFTLILQRMLTVNFLRRGVTNTVTSDEGKRNCLSDECLIELH